MNERSKDTYRIPAPEPKRDYFEQFLYEMDAARDADAMQAAFDRGMRNASSHHHDWITPEHVQRKFVHQIMGYIRQLPDDIRNRWINALGDRLQHETEPLVDEILASDASEGENFVMSAIDYVASLPHKEQVGTIQSIFTQYARRLHIKDRLRLHGESSGKIMAAMFILNRLNEGLSSGSIDTKTETLWRDALRGPLNDPEVLTYMSMLDRASGSRKAFFDTLEQVNAEIRRQKQSNK